MENDQNHEAIHETLEAIMTLQAQIERTQACQRPGDNSGLYQRESHAKDYVSPSSPQVNGSVEPTDLEKELEEVRTNFEAYRKEMGVGTIELREEVLQYQRESCQLSMAFANANARIEFLKEQYPMAQEQYQAAEELASADTQTERLRNNCSNLCVKKKIWEKDIEVQELRTKVDRCVENTSRAREPLVEAETSWKHLQEWADGFVKQVQTNEEKIAVHKRRTSSATVPTGDTSRLPASEDCPEQKLKAEVAELRVATKAAEVDLAAARNHVQQFQESTSLVKMLCNHCLPRMTSIRRRSKLRLLKSRLNGRHLRRKYHFSR
ncbi:MLP1_5 [Sanghuangporus vaninii]